MKSLVSCVFAALAFSTFPTMSSAQQTALNVSEWGAAQELLVQAKKLIVEKGWQQGATEAVSKECMATALENAWKDSKKSIVDFNYARDALSKAIGVPREPALRKGDPLSVPYWGRHFMEWNDAKGRTEEQVLAAFDKAIGRAETMRQLSVKANLSPDLLNAPQKK